MAQTKKILVAPLNWGLGHATRCIPIIRSLLEHEATVIIGANDRPLDLLRHEFPTLRHICLPGLNISYKGNLAVGIIQQLPHIARVTLKEHKELEKLVEKAEIDAVISDNRFGLFSKRIPSIYVTHQISIAMPHMLDWTKSPVARINVALINRFSECWIPDFSGGDNLSAELAHSSSLPNNTFYIGPLSRFQKYRNVPKQYDLIVVLSGPEPQRTKFERLVISQLQTTRVKALVVQGIPETKSCVNVTDTVSIVSHLTSEELNKAILSSDVVLSRSGYSTIMDLAVLGAKAIFVPTPGQTEQEYLARIYKNRKIFYSECQSDFQLGRAMMAVRGYTGIVQNPTEMSTLSMRIQHLLTSIP